MQAGERGGDADDARDEREDDEEPRRQVADGEVDREQAHRRRRALHCRNEEHDEHLISCCLCARRRRSTAGTLTRVPALVDAVVDGPASDDRDDDVHDEVEGQEGRPHGPVGGGRHAAAGLSRSRERTDGTDQSQLSTLWVREGISTSRPYICRDAACRKDTRLLAAFLELKGKIGGKARQRRTYDFLLCEEARCHSLLPIGEYVGGCMGSVAFCCVQGTDLISRLPRAAARGCIQSAETGRGYARTAGEKVRRSYVSTGLSCSLVQPYEYDKVAA